MAETESQKLERRIKELQAKADQKAREKLKNDK